MTPYRMAAQGYFDLGWSPIPVPHELKSPVPDGFTGASGKYVDAAQLKSWRSPKGRARAGKLIYPPGNVAFRLPRDVLGIDVDNYDGKDGAKTYVKALDEWGELPDTWISSSRTDGVSGIRLYRIPEGLSWPGELPQGKGVELIRWDHRYMLVEPSVHDKTKAIYRWFNGIEALTFGRHAVDEAPGVDELPELPAAWVEGLTSGVKWTDRPVDEDMSAREIQDWLKARVSPEGAECSTLRRTRVEWERKVRKAGDSGGAHEAATDGVWAILKDAATGHAGVSTALKALRKVFLVAVGERRSKNGEARREWARSVSRGIRKVSAEEAGEEGTEDPCAAVGAVRSVGGTPRGSKDMDWRTDDVGNAARLIRVMDGRARWVPAWDSWAVWDEAATIWRPDDDGQVARWAVKSVNAMAEEAAYLEDEKTRKAFVAWSRASGNAGKLSAATEVARSRSGMTVPAERFDADDRALACTNGTVVLGRDGVSFRPTAREDLNTRNTGVEWKADAKSSDWNRFLKQVLPDVELREWIQRLVGYSLLGANPERLLIAVQGMTSTGKSTFAESIKSALGAYAGVMTASALRDNQEDRPRPDLMAILPVRIAVAEELSAAQHLHPDQIKRLTGNVSIKVRGMRSNLFVERVPAFTPWLVSNEVPTIEGADDAIRRRLVVVPFDQFIAPGKEDHRLRLRLSAAEARQAILAWAVEGYRRWAVGAGGRLTAIPAGALGANLKYAEEMSELHAFVAQVMEFGDGYYEPRQRFYDAYTHWSERNGMRGSAVLTQTMFGRRLSGMGTGVDKRTVDGRQVWVRTGARLCGEWEQIVQ